MKRPLSGCQLNHPNFSKSRPSNPRLTLTMNTKRQSQIHQIISTLQTQLKHLKRIVAINQKQNHIPSTASSLKIQRNTHPRKLVSLSSTSTNHGNKRIIKSKEYKKSSNNLNPNKKQIESEIQNELSKISMDVYELQHLYMKSNDGKMTNNIVELYQFYKKQVQKYDKSTRIMMSMEMSNIANSTYANNNNHTKDISVKNNNSSLNNFNRQRQSNKNYDRIVDKQEEYVIHEELSDIANKPNEQQYLKKNNRNQASQEESHSNSNRMMRKSNSLKLNDAQYQKIVEKRSALATDLLTKGCYNMENLAKMLHSKRYKLSRSKELELNQNQEISSHMKKNKTIQNVQVQNQLNINQQNDSLIKNRQTPQKISGGKSNQNHSLKKAIQAKLSQEKVVEIHQLQSKNPLPTTTFNLISSPIQPTTTQLKIDNFLVLNESPILMNNPIHKQDFLRSKYYVQPIPAKSLFSLNNKQSEMNSLSLKSNSRIIDVDSLPFQL